MNIKLVRALANPTRIKILAAIGEGPTNPVQLAEKLGEKLGVVSYHLKVLRATGCIQLIDREATGTERKRSYELTPSATPTRQLVRPRMVQSGLSHPPASVVRSIVESGMSNLGTDTLGTRSHHLSCGSLVVDRQGWREISSAINEALDRISAAHEESAQRLADSDEERIGATIAFASFETPGPA